MISERLIQKREEAGLKQAELARRIGIGRDSYNRYERSGSRPSLEILALIANELNTSTDYLLGNTNNPAPPGQKVPGFAERFIQLRAGLGLTREELAADFCKRFRRSCTQDMIHKYENGQRMPEATTLMDFADFFGVSEAYLLGDSEIKEPNAQEMERRYRVKKLLDFEYDDWQVRKIIEDGNLNEVYENTQKALGKASMHIAEKRRDNYKETDIRAVILLDDMEFSLITDFRDMSNDSKKDLCRMAKLLAENSNLKKILKNSSE